MKMKDNNQNRNEEHRNNLMEFPHGGNSRLASLDGGASDMLPSVEQKVHQDRSRSVSPEHTKSKLIQTLEDEDKEFWDDVLYRKGKIEYFYEKINEEKDPIILQSKTYKYNQLRVDEMKEIVQITKDYAYDYRDNYIPASNKKDKETVINMIIETLTKFLFIFQNELNDMYIFFDRLEIEYLVEYFKKMLE